MQIIVVLVLYVLVFLNLRREIDLYNIAMVAALTGSNDHFPSRNSQSCTNSLSMEEKRTSISQHDEGISILIVEDNDDDAMLMIANLKQNYPIKNFAIVSTQEAFINTLTQHRWNVILSDHVMPAFSSHKVLLILKEHNDDTPVVIVSGAIGEEVAVDAVKNGAYDYVMKNNLIRLAAAVSNAIEAADIKRLNQQARRELIETNQRLRDLAAHLETIREDERRTIAHHIHDELGGNLAALKLDLHWTREQIRQGKTDVDEKLATMLNIIDESIYAVRHIISEMRPSVLDNLGIIATLEWYFQQFLNRTGLSGTLYSDVDHIEFPNDKYALAIFRTCQEALNNVNRHARASYVDLIIKTDKNTKDISVIIRDNGIGIETDDFNNKGKFGIIGMKERATALGWNIDISPTKDSGTEVSLVIPFTHETVIETNR